ncbi:hypothetical protein PT2222_70358 [Paraburkholderia tropica]
MSPGLLARGLDAAELREQVLECLALENEFSHLRFIARDGRGAFVNLGHLRDRHDGHADFVGDHEIAGMDDHAAARNRHVDLERLATTRERRVRLARADGFRGNREVEEARLVGVPATAVDHRADDARVFRETRHEAAPDRRFGLAECVDHDDVAGPRDREDFEAVDDVAGRELDRQCGADDLVCGRTRLDIVAHGAVALERIGDHAGQRHDVRHRDESRDQVGIQLGARVDDDAHLNS